MAVRIIPARRQSAVRKIEIQPALRVAAYCRVSTELEEQETSYEAQVSHYTDYISSHDGWDLAGIYADEGISGTSLAKREQFNLMLKACEQGRIDMVITKSISRWARNTLDSLQTIRKLKALGIPVLFEKENCNTMDASGELLITILSSLAQQESQSISQNVRMGLQYRFQQGKPMLNHSLFLGYTKTRGDSELTIVPEEAKIVRRIFREYMEGYTLGEIKERLEADGIPTPAGKDVWYASTIQSILTNEKYMGDLLLQKTYTVDFLTKEKAKNSGRFPQYYVENAHPPIVPKEVFRCVQGILLKRERHKAETGKRVRTTPHNALSGRLCCGMCGNQYRRLALPYKTVWRCKTRLDGGGCEARTISEAKAKAIVAEAFSRLKANRKALIRIQKDLRNKKKSMLDEALRITEKRIADLEADIHERESRDPVGGNDRERFIDRKIAEELSELEDRKVRYLEEKADLSMQEVQIHMLSKLIDGERKEKKEEDPACYDLLDFFERTDVVDDIPENGYSDDLTKRYIDRIEVTYDYVTVCFKAGLEIRIED